MSQALPTCLPSVALTRKNKKVLDYVHGRLGEQTSAGQCILHIAPGGAIHKIEWRSMERAEDIVEE